MKRTFFILLMAVVAIGAQAQTKMILHQKTGGDIEIAFSDNPVATFEGNEMVITTAKTILRFSIDNLQDTSFDESGNADNIESVTLLSPDAGPSRIYDINGRLVKTVPAGEPVSFGTLPQGTYVIKNNNSSYKINKR